MTEYDSIFKRQSIRKYEDKPIEADVLESIKGYLKNIEPLIPNVAIKMTIVERDMFNKIVKGRFIVSAPYYLIITSEEKEGYLLNAGYMVEQAVLHLTTLGIGSCWLGGGKEQKEVAYTLPYVAAIAFGYGEGDIYRQSLEAIKRNKISDWATGDTERYISLLEGVRVAPSAVNSQTWTCQATKEKIRWFNKKDNIVKRKLLGKMIEINMGIALSHLVICGKAENKTVTFEKEDLINGIGYVLTTYIKDNLV